jgi:hypothetical protein
VLATAEPLGAALGGQKGPEMKPQFARFVLASFSFAFYLGLPGESMLLPSADSAISEMHATLHEGSIVADEEGGEESQGEEGEQGEDSD